MRKKWLTTMQVFDEYEKRIAKARLDKKLRFPTDEKTREEIINETKKVLGYKEELVPKIDNMEEIYRQSFSSYDIIQLRYTTWENFYGCGTLFMPHGEDKVPLVFVLCGHTLNGRLSSNMYMAQHLAKNGVAAFVPDNIGQGDRDDGKNGNHGRCITPFYCGLSLQGLIVMETIALIRYMKNHPRIDENKIGSCGNSGGGTLNLFLAALAPEISALASTGYPCEFTYILSKERRHCACNILPGIAYGPEMWEVLSIFAPKPILLSQGKFDDLIPIDLGLKNARKVQNVYVQLGKEDNFNFVRTDTKHSWVEEDIRVISNFLLKSLGAESFTEYKDDFEIEKYFDLWHVEIPKNSFTTSQMCENITGVKMPEGTHLCDIFTPRFNGKIIDKNDLADDIGRGNVMRVLAQFESMFNK